MNTIKILNTKIQYDEQNIKIIDSYKVTDNVEMTYILKEFILKTGYKSKRSLKSWIKEWKSHNRLYKLGLFRLHTKDCDLEENEKIYRLIVYKFLGI